MMKLALIGDLHLDPRSVRYAHVLAMLDWVIEDAEAASHGDPLAWVLLGDLFEGQPTGTVYADLFSRVRRMAQRGRVGLIIGNHEAWDGLAFLESSALAVAWNGFPLLSTEGARVVLIPYPRRGRPPFSDSVQAPGIQDSMRAAADLISETIEQHQRGAVQDGVPLIVCGHFTIEGMTIRDADFELHTAQEVIVPQSAFEGVALGAVGHIHRAQDVAPNLIGVGSLTRHSFAEAEEEKSYTLVTIDEGRVTWERRAVPCRAMVVVEAEWGASGWVKKTVSVPSWSFVTAPEAKIILRVHEDALATAPTAEELKNLLGFEPAHFVLDRQVISAQRTRAPAITRNDALGDQFTAWCQANGLVIDAERTARMRSKIAEIEG